MMKWKKGAPDAPGWWLVEESTSDVFAWLVSWDRDETGDGTKQPRYLRYSDGMDSAPVDFHQNRWPIRRSFGPIPKHRGRR